MQLFQFVRSAHNWLAGRSGYEKLPDRVRQTIDRQQEDSEILIGWVQLAILVTFAGLYTVAPSAFPDETRFEPVPWALGAYFVFTITRLILAYARRLPFWMLVLSVIVDMLLLLGLIWTFHLQYEQPASFYLKAPTLLYVFIFIALRALRFEAGFVVLAGLVASAGWLLMVFYAVKIAPGNTTVTGDYIEYMTSNNVLLGAEFDKVISILMVTVILTTGIARAHQLLTQSVVESAAARDLSRFVPTEVVRQIAASEHGATAGQTELREATIMFIDIENFTAIGETLSPQNLVATLNDYFTVVSAPIQKYQGAICQFQGDAILASFNLPEANPDYAWNAVTAAQEIQRLLKIHTFNGVPLQARIGITTGEVVGGFVGTPERLGYTIHGDDVNLAARLEQLNKQHRTRILLDELTCERAGRDGFAFRRLGTETVRGRENSVNVYSLSA